MECVKKNGIYLYLQYALKLEILKLITIYKIIKFNFMGFYGFFSGLSSPIRANESEDSTVIVSSITPF